MNEKGKKNNGNAWIVNLRMSKTRTIAVTAIVCLLVAAIIVYAFTVQWSGTVALSVTDPNIQVYSDANCTTVATSINLGSVQRGANSSPVYLWIKNLGLDTVWIYWNSTLYQQTNQITESWVYVGTGGQWNSTALPAGNVLPTLYQVYTRVNCTSGTYNWQLKVGAEAYQS